MDFANLKARYPSLAFVVPYLVFIALLGVEKFIPLPQGVEMPLRILVLGGVLWFFSRDVIELHSEHLLASCGLGILVFVIWILPDALFPHYRESIVFQNGITGSLHSSLSNQSRLDPFILGVRCLRAVLLVPIIEELFWRAWLMRWLISPRFDDVRLGTYNLQSFALTAILFASEHGPFWDVGLAAGLIYNWWMVHTRSLGDCILAHAVTNACLCGYVLATHKWEYWL